MRPIIGKSIVRHVIKRVRIIEAVAAIFDGILGHLPRVIVCSVREGSFQVWWVDDILRSGRKAEPRLRKAGVAMCGIANSLAGIAARFLA